MMRGLRLAGLIAAALVLQPFTAAASDQDDALALAQRIASRGGFAQAAVMLHALPKNLPAGIPLPHAMLLGSVVDTVRQRSGSTGNSATGTTFVVVPEQPMMLYYDAPDGRDRVEASYEAALRQAGWQPAPDMRSRLPIPQGGFTMQFPKITQYCSPGEPRAIVSIGMTDAPAGLDVTVLSGGHAVELQCGNQPSPFAMFQRQSPLPTFTAAAGISISSSGPTSDGSTTGARIESTLGLAAVFEAFAKQLRDAGWSAGPATSAPTTRTQTFSKTVDGKPYTTLLAFYALDATHFVALADVSSLTPLAHNSEVIRSGL